MAMAKTTPEMSLRRVVIPRFRAAGSPCYDAAEAPSEVRESGTGRLGMDVQAAVSRRSNRLPTRINI
jgi:hypothetical protein